MRHASTRLRLAAAPAASESIRAHAGAATPISRSKVSAPRLVGVVPRPRLLARIDALRDGGRRLVWLSGAPGSGKTTLASAYVDHRQDPVLWLRADAADADPATLFAHWGAAARRSGLADDAVLPPFAREHLADVPLFARLFFRALFAAFTAPCLVVLDDAHAVTADRASGAAIAILVEELPESWFMLATSRDAFPDAMARLLVNGVAGEIRGAALAFDIDETRGLLAARHGRVVDAEALHAHTGGWAAALALRADLGPAATSAGSVIDTRRQIDAYLAVEVFQALSDEERRGLLVVAWLPLIRPGWLTSLDVAPAVRRRLEAMAGNGILVQTWEGESGAPEYRFHPLFSDFLRERARELCTGQQLLAAQEAIVAVLHGAGMSEAALELMLEMRAWPDACELIAALAPGALAAARQRTVIAWADIVPKARRSAWVRFWQGQAQMFSHPERGSASVRQAYEEFKLDPDPAVRHRALAAILSTYFLEYSTQAPMSRWLGEFHDLGAHYDTIDLEPVRAMAAVGICSALIVREPHHPDFKRWLQRLDDSLDFDVDPNVKIRGAMLLAKHCWFTGQHARAWPLAERLGGELRQPGVQPYSRLVSHLVLIYDAWARAEPRRGMQVAGDALACAEASGIHLIDCHLQLHSACFALADGDDAGAATLIEAATSRHDPARRIESWHLFITRAWQALRAGTCIRAVECAAIALDAAAPIGPPPQCAALVAMCYALLGAGDAAELALRLGQLAPLAEATGNCWAMFHVHLIEARDAQRQGDTARCRRHVGEAFAIGRRNHLYTFLLAEPRVLASLSGEALLGDIETGYAHGLIRAQRLLPPEALLWYEAWPRPVRIRTLGGFELILDGRPLVPRAKAQRKTLELLKAVIALGAHDVSADALADALWPEADGDAARSAFDMALHRLRKLLGRDDALVLRDGRVSLDPRLCWVDSLAFERLLDGFDGARQDEATRASLRRQALDLYRGDFLAGAATQPWLVGKRERIRQRYLRALQSSRETEGRDCDRMAPQD